MHRLPPLRRAGLVLAAACALASPAAAEAQARKRAKPAEPAAPPASSLGSPRDEAATEPAAPRAVPTEADLALLRAINFMFEPAPREIRIIAVEDLALLGDARGLDALAHMILDLDPPVAEAAVRAVGRFRHERAERILTNVLRHPGLPLPLKLAAVRAVPFQDTPSSRELLTDLSTSDRVAPPVREAATDMIRRMASGTAAREEQTK